MYKNGQKPKMTQNFEPLENYFLFLKKTEFLHIGAIGIVAKCHHKQLGSKMDTPNPPIWPREVGQTLNGHTVFLNLSSKNSLAKKRWHLRFHKKKIFKEV